MTKEFEFASSPVFMEKLSIEQMGKILESVRRKRFLAGLIDEVIILTISILIGFLSLGIGLLLFFLLYPVVGLIYYAFTLGGDASATVGMRIFNIKLIRVDGRAMDPGYGAAFAVLYYLSISFLTPFVLVVGLISKYKRFLHDIVLGTIVINASSYSLLRKSDFPSEGIKEGA
ncbi:RDD family protein [Polycladidibacter stylochi]|uniref:RDD family protein n=1 Tax=Polycladidibacter stylochi TaxID=1807766 RepID=UPI000AF49136|nr:RDD family protein [Pseudovibrio stylochi]